MHLLTFPLQLKKMYKCSIFDMYHILLFLGHIFLLFGVRPSTENFTCRQGWNSSRFPVSSRSPRQASGRYKSMVLNLKIASHLLFQEITSNGRFFFYKGEDTDNRKMEELEDLIWNPENGLSDRQVDQFLIISR